MWKLTDDDKLINKALNSRWKYGHKKWHYDEKAALIMVKETNYVMGIINPKLELNHVSDGTEIDIHEKKVGNERSWVYGSWATPSAGDRKTDKTETRYQKWILEGESELRFSIRNLELIKSDWMKIKPLYSNDDSFGFGQYLEVSHCGKLLTIQGGYTLHLLMFFSLDMPVTKY